MLKRLESYPSDIAQSVIQYILMLESKENQEEETYHVREVLFLFLESLKYSKAGFLETDEGEFLLTCNWSDIWGTAMSGFLDYWFQGKTKKIDEGMFGAPDILRDWVQWCFDKDYFKLEKYQDFMRSLPLGKSIEMKRLHVASKLLYRLHSPVTEPKQATANPANLLSFVKFQKPNVKIEGYMKLVSTDNTQAHFLSEGGTEIGPVLLSHDLVNSLKMGDVLNVSLGKYQECWRILESGNIYSDGVIF